MKPCKSIEWGYFDYAEAYLDGAFDPFGEDCDQALIVACLDRRENT